MATGQLGAAQLQRLSQALSHLAREGLFRVVLIHHPPVTTRAGRFKRLIDSTGLRRVLRENGAELVLHGHDHVHSVVWLDGPQGRRIPAVGVPSASAVSEHMQDPAAYNLYEITGSPGAWHCHAISRGLRSGSDGGVEELTRRMLTD
jgi:3',5'-cyclic AMP phosphodiesterase CpdA